MSTKKNLAAAIFLLLLFAAGTRAEALRGGAAARCSDSARRMEAGQRRAARRRANKTMKKRTTQGQVQEGVWGGPHVRLMVRAGGATLEFDCARGEITEPLKTDDEGRFDLPGTHTRQGPSIRVGLTPPARPVRYLGRVEGRTMTLSMKSTGKDQETETFTLTRGSEGQLRKCR